MGLGAEQLRNARTIISVGRSMGATQRDLVIAIMTAMQESTLRNLNYGDRDSLGLFQQRAGWGSASQRRNPQYAARKFFSTLFKVRGRTGMSLTGAAQAVQRSAFPNAYAKWESLARGVLGGSTNLGAEASVFEEEEGFAPEPEERDFNPIPAMLAQGPNLDVVRLPGTNDQEEPEGPEGSAPFNLREMLYG